MSLIANKCKEAMVEHMTIDVMLEKVSKVRQRYLQKHAQDYCIIGNELYYHGKDGSLRICMTKAKYLEVLFHAQSYFPRGHFSTKVIVKALMISRLQWPTLFRDLV